jgi:hypothetical protein
MRIARLAVLALALLAGAAATQSFTDSFSYQDGTVVPGWTEKRGDWIISAGRLYVLPIATSPYHGYITKDGYNLKDSVTEATILYDGMTATIQSAGLLARENGGATSTSLVMCKAQDNSTSSLPAGFDLGYIYEYATSGSAVSQAISPIVSVCRLRFIVVDSTATMLVDRDMDGIWDQSLQRTLSSQLGAGETGCMGGLLQTLPRSSAIDDFALFDAVLTSTGSAAPGSTLTLNLRGRVPGATYQAACSLANSPGIPLGTRRIPLMPDGLMFASFQVPALFAGFSGSLDITASATAQILIPKNPALSGLRFYAGFVEIDPRAPAAINSISNDLPITVS